ncbi:CAP domain-containing protein [Myxococcus sp. RHSTA-1-4]|uniref:CAP domain-containing protein n=1 Tax=Myxococcus sp. RHSTA-1-4 TaxID=2874601 RepID=UPI001CBF1596|nr:CAP domain-containing protein [Myxococcus sp. RHSTA-1-4]MBZ4420542.1 serine protease [Myxococcus sp. RHSTA-1-4]
MRSSSSVLRWSALLLLTPLLGCGTGSKAAQRQPASRRQTVTASREKAPAPKDFERDMVAAHNHARAQAKPTPKPALPPLTWSSEAARKAASWAKECRFEHNPNRGDFGENLAAATPGAWTTPDVVKSWADEAVDYDFAKKACKRGKVCGHYTQVVWRKTAAVGCATVLCNKNSPFGAQHPTWQNWVCNYAPPGNYIGQSPY